ncbi:MAG: hypothetical protein AMXMBFR36_19000 [Acidobacteriota bacterium]
MSGVRSRVSALLVAAVFLAVWKAGADDGTSFDLRTETGVAAVAGEWRVAEARLVPVDFRRAGADGQPGAEPSSTFEVEPRAGVAGFDDSSWPVVAPAALAERIGPGRVSFAWYRFRFTVPASQEGKAAVFETVIDDAAEIWVDGELRRCPGQAGGSMVAGWGAPNRVVVARRATAGQRIEIAVFAVNGPISAAPTNYLWMKRARLEFVEAEAGPVAVPSCEENVEIVRFEDPSARLDAIVSRNPKLFLIGEGFTFTEGPVWSPRDAALFFSDPNQNRIYRWSEPQGLAVFRERSGYDGADVARYRQPGSNGLAGDREGRLVAAQHGHRRIVRREPAGREAVLADRFDGRRLNSPNDLVFRADGTLYFTDPFFGLPGFGDDPARELPYQGVYRVHEGKVELLARELAGPNGLAFSPDERFLYVGDWDDAHKAVVRYPVLADGRLGPAEEFLDLTGEPGADAIDGVKTDELGNVYVSGPGGLWIVAPDGTRLALVKTPRHVHNLAWGEDGTVLYLAARDHLYRMPLRVRGHAPHLAPAPRLEVADAELESLLPEGGRPERLAQGFRWLEGPAWDAAAHRLLFSDIPANRVYELTSDGRTSTFLERSGYSGTAPFAGREPGSNGLVEDAEGRLILCQHGDRRVVRRERDGSLTVLADRFDGRRLNSPNDAIVTPSGEVWFTDPPFGLPGGFDDPGRELAFQGVYRIRTDGRVELLTDEVRAPNGLALAPDGRTLYVSNAEPGVAAHYYAFEVRADGTLGPKRLFFDATAWSRAGRPGAPDGIEVDPAGRIWATGPGGVHVFAAAGRHLGTIAFDRPVANLEFGDGGDLYLTADTAIWRLRTRAFGESTQGVRR